MEHLVVIAMRVYDGMTKKLPPAISNERLVPPNGPACGKGWTEDDSPPAAVVEAALDHSRPAAVMSRLLIHRSFSRPPSVSST